MKSFIAELTALQQKYTDSIERVQNENNGDSPDGAEESANNKNDPTIQQRIMAEQKK